MEQKFVVLLVLLYNQLFMIQCSTLNAILSRTDDFFENLKIRYPEVEDGNISNKVLMEIDEFKSLIQRSYDIEEEVKFRRKRELSLKSLLKDPEGTYIFNNIIENSVVPVKFPVDINLFVWNNESYAASIESDGPNDNLGKKLVLYKFKAGDYVEQYQVPVRGGTMVEIHTIDGSIYLVSAENKAVGYSSSLYGSVLYQLVDRPEGAILEKIQTLDALHPNNIVFWDFIGEVYLAVSTESRVNSENKVTAESTTLIYQWLGKHFDLIQKIRSYNAQSTTPFMMGSSMYLVLANQHDEMGETDIDSEIFKFNLQSSKFMPYQRIRTHAAKDIKHFNIKELSKNNMEHFLVVANSYELDINGEKNYNIDSVIYKYSHDYFIPFQSLKLNSPSHLLPVTGSNGEFLLLVSYEDQGVKGYQYNGWRFTEIPIQFTTGSFGPGVASMRFLQQPNKMLISVANRQISDNEDNTYSLEFTHRNDLKVKHEKFQEWCDKQSTEVNKSDLDELLKSYKSAPQLDSPFINITNDIIFDNAEIENLNTDVCIGCGKFSDDLIDELNHISEQAQLVELDVKKTTDILDIAIKNGFNIMFSDRTFHLPSLQLDCASEFLCTFKDVQVINLNDNYFNDFIDKAVDNSCKTLASLELENVEVEELTARYINDHPSATLIDLITPQRLNTEFIVNGNVFVKKTLNVKGLLDGVKIDATNVILKNEDQVFLGNLLAEQLDISNLDILGSINGMDLNMLQKGVTSIERNNEHFDTLDVGDLKVNGLVSGRNINDILEHAMTKNSDQVISGYHTYNYITANRTMIGNKKLSNIDLEDILRVKDAEINVPSTWYLKQKVTPIKEVNIFKTINNIPVASEGQFNFFRNTLDEIIVTGLKTFFEVSVENRFIGPENSKFSSKLKFKDAESLKNISFFNKIQIEGTIQVKDILDENNLYFASKIVKNGLKLKDEIVPNEMVFRHHMILNNVNTNVVNGISPKSWVKRSAPSHQVVNGKKIFQKPVTFNGKIAVGLMNGVDLIDLVQDSMNLDGNQDITGRKTFTNITCDSVLSDKVRLGRRNWFDALRVKDIINNDVIVTGSIITDRLEAEEILVDGNAANLAFINDIAFDDKAYEVTGAKLLDNINTYHVNVNGTVNTITSKDLNQIETRANNDEGVVKGTVVLNNNIYVDRLYYTGTLDNVPHTKFNGKYLENTGDQIISSPFALDEIVLDSGANLTTDTINDINLTNLFENSYRINVDEEIPHVILKKGVTVHKNLFIGGRINKVKVQDEIILKNSGSAQEIIGLKSFTGNLKVRGTFTVDGFMSGINISQLCSHMDGRTPNLEVKSSVFLKEEPKIFSLINGRYLKPLDGREMWLSDEPIIHKGALKFHDILFDKYVTLHGNLNGQSLTNLSESYLSKTLNRAMKAEIILDNVIATNGKMNNSNVNNLVNDLDFNKFVHTVLLNDRNQTLTARHRFNEFHSENFRSELLNGLDLSKDVLRYDVDNSVVKGPITIKSLKTEDIFVPNGFTVQNVDITNWNESAVRLDRDAVLNGSFNFDGVSIKELRLDGKLNNQRFDTEHIFTKGKPQKITGQKIFNLETPVFFKKFLTNGNVNTVNISDLLEKQVVNDANITLQARKVFLTGLSVDSLNAGGQIYDVDLTHLNKEVASLKPFNDMEEEFESLTRTAASVARSLNSQAFYFDHFELLKTFDENLISLFPYKLHEEYRLIAMFNQNNSVNFQVYNFESSKGLLRKDDISMNSPPGVPLFTAPFNTRHHQFMYYEIANKDSKSHSAMLFNGEELITLPTNETTCIASFYVPILNKDCIFIGQKFGSSKILCKTENKMEFHSMQLIKTYNVKQVSAMSRDGIPCLVIVNEGDSKENIGSHVAFYKFNNDTSQFYLQEVINVPNPVSIATIHYKGICYMAVSSARVSGTAHTGFTTVYRYNETSSTFSKFNIIGKNNPVNVRLVNLPSNELVLYLQTADQAEPFFVYTYKGTAGFIEATKGLKLKKSTELYTITTRTLAHYVLLIGDNQGQVLRAGFKGIPPKF